MGNLQYSEGNLPEAESNWNDCIDAVFSQLYALNNHRKTKERDFAAIFVVVNQECKLSLPHPLKNIQYLSYTAKEFLPNYEIILAAEVVKP